MFILHAIDIQLYLKTGHANLPFWYSRNWMFQRLTSSFISRSEQKVTDRPPSILFPFFRNFLQHRIDSITPRQLNVKSILFSSPILILFCSYTGVLRKIITNQKYEDADKCSSQWNISRADQCKPRQSISHFTPPLNKTIEVHLPQYKFKFGFKAYTFKMVWRNQKLNSLGYTLVVHRYCPASQLSTILQDFLFILL